MQNEKRSHQKYVFVLGFAGFVAATAWLGRGIAPAAPLTFADTTAVARATPLALIDKSRPYTNGELHWTPADYPFAQAALQNQLNAATVYWHTRGFTVMPFGQKAPAGAWRIYIRDSCGGPANMAWHGYDGAPYACIASVGGGGYWWMTRAMEHEASEMASDPLANYSRPEIVDPVVRYFGAICNGQFTFDYNACTGWPFVDFMLPAAARNRQGFKDYLHQVAR